MPFPFLIAFIIFLLVLHHNLNKGKKLERKQEDSYWKKEYEANTTRRQSLDDLTFIDFKPDDFFPVKLLEQGQVSAFLTAYPQVKDILPRFVALSEKKITNLSHFTNTDLKFKYGIANFNLLAEYDENYLELISLLHQYGNAYYQAGYLSQALRIFEYAISIGSDVADTFLLAARVYQLNGDSDKLNSLHRNVQGFPEARKNLILAKLNEGGM